MRGYFVISTRALILSVLWIGTCTTENITAATTSPVSTASTGTTVLSTTPAPTASSSTTESSTTPAPTASSSTTESSTTPAPTASSSTTESSTTPAPTASSSTTESSTTHAPTASSSTTELSTTHAPTASSSTTEPSTTPAPTASSSTAEPSTIPAPTASSSTTESSTTPAPTASSSTTEPSTTPAPTASSSTTVLSTTHAPTASSSTTESSTTHAPTASSSTTESSTTHAPTASSSTTESSTTPAPTASSSTTVLSTTHAPTASSSTTESSTTHAPTASSSTTESSTTPAPTASSSTTESSTTPAPTASSSTTESSTTPAPTASSSTTVLSTTHAPTASSSTTELSTTHAPTASSSTTESSTTHAPTASSSTTVLSTTHAPTASSSTTELSTTHAPTASSSTTEPSTTHAPTASSSTTESSTTHAPTASSSTTESSTTPAPTASSSTTVLSTTHAPTASSSTTESSTTHAPTASSSTTEPSTTPAPTASSSTTVLSTTHAPTASSSTTEPSTTPAPTASSSTTVLSTTHAPTASSSTTESSTTHAPTASSSTTESSTTPAPTASSSTTVLSTTHAPTASSSTRESSTTHAPTASSSTTESSTTPAPTASSSTTELSTTPAPTASSSTTEPSTTPAPTASSSTTESSTTPAPTASSSTTVLSTTPAPTASSSTTVESTTHAPTASSSTTVPSTTHAPTASSSTTELSTTPTTTASSSTTVLSTTNAPTASYSNTVANTSPTPTASSSTTVASGGPNPTAGSINTVATSAPTLTASSSTTVASSGPNPTASYSTTVESTSPTPTASSSTTVASGGPNPTAGSINTVATSAPTLTASSSTTVASSGPNPTASSSTTVESTSPTPTASSSTTVASGGPNPTASSSTTVASGGPNPTANSSTTVASTGLTPTASSSTTVESTSPTPTASSSATVASGGPNPTASSSTTVATSGPSPTAGSINTVANTSPTPTASSSTTVASTGLTPTASSSTTVASSGPNPTASSSTTVASGGPNPSAGFINTVASSGPTPTASSSNTVASSGPTPTASSSATVASSGPNPTASYSTTVESTSPTPTASSSTTVASGGPNPIASSSTTVASGGPNPTANSSTTVASTSPTPTASSSATVASGGPNPTASSSTTVATSGPSPTAGSINTVANTSPTPTSSSSTTVASTGLTPTASSSATVASGGPNPTASSSATVATSGPSPTTGSINTVASSGPTPTASSINTVASSGPSPTTGSINTVASSGSSPTASSSTTVATSGPSPTTGSINTVGSSGSSPTASSSATVASSGPNPTAGSINTVVSSGPTPTAGSSTTVASGGPNPTASSSTTVASGGPNPTAGSINIVESSGPTPTASSSATVASTGPNPTAGSSITAESSSPAPTGISTTYQTTTTAPPSSCEIVNSTLSGTGNVPAVLCNLSNADYNCLSPSIVAGLSSDDLVTLLTCKLAKNESNSKNSWVLFLRTFAEPLQGALDKFSVKNFSVSLPDSSFLDAVGEVIVNNFTATQLTDAPFISEWFQTRIGPFLPSVSADFLSNLGSKNFSCEVYQVVIEALSSREQVLTGNQTLSVVNSFIVPFLTGDRCVQSLNDSEWLVKNFGQFRRSLSFSKFTQLKSNFDGVKAAEVLTSSQLAELCSDPSRLKGPQDVNTVMAAVGPTDLASFFDIVSPKIRGNSSAYSPEVKGAFLHGVLARGEQFSAALPDSEVQTWVNERLQPLLSSMSVADVAPFFTIIRGRNCSLIKTALESLGFLGSSFNSNIRAEIQKNIQQLLTGPKGLDCYQGGNFYNFIEGYFNGYELPDLGGFLSIIPASRRQELLGTIPPESLSDFLNMTNTVKNLADLCTVFNNYNRTAEYLEKELIVSEAVGRQTLECVWPSTLNASSPVEVDQWFDVALRRYLPYLSSKVINPTQLSGASCLSYRRLVSILGNYTYSGTDFTRADVYSSIKAYLKSSNGSPRCYSASDPLLNSTAWFSKNIGAFTPFVSLADLQSFVSDSQIGVFLENPESIQLFNSSRIASDVTRYYGAQLYAYKPNFSPLRLLGVLLCGVPGSAYTSLSAADSQIILDSLKTSCQSISPEVTAALVANFPTITTDTIQTLGNQSIGLTEGQISAAPPEAINKTITTLGAIPGWNQGQVNNIIQSIANAGFKIDSGSKLVEIGTLIGGVPSENISKIPSAELLTVANNTTFINNILTAPAILQETFVNKIVSFDESKVVQNVPDELAGYIPPVVLSTPIPVNVTLINKKSWKQDQAQVLFRSVASASDNTEELSESILQGFTCSSVQKLPRQKITQLVRACRPRSGRKKVFLKEAQLTCMYNYVKDDASLNFSDFPADMLLYYSTGKLTKENCRSFFSAQGGADFSVLSSVLNRQSILFTSAKDCLGVSGVSLTKDQVDVLGNMACTLDSSYIQNSDPQILEKLKNCGDLSDSQVAAVQTQLFSGNTAYGKTSTWTLDTLNKLGMLPLYLSQSFWNTFSSTTKKTFLKTFIPLLKKQNTDIRKLRRLFTASNSNTRRLTRATTECTAGQITEAVIAETDFSVGYDSTQFDACLNNTLLKDNLAAVSEKVVDTSLLKVLLSKIQQLYPAGFPESVVKVLNAVSREASVADINTWNITTVDTLSALMNPKNGDWTSDKSKAVIMRYLSKSGNVLGTPEINAIQSYLCTLDVDTLRGITAPSLQKANSVNVSSCSAEQKSAMYSVAKSAFSSQRSDATTYYHLISPYLGGAPLVDIIDLSNMSISMDITTFLSLNPDVIKGLNVTTVRNLMGENVVDLKLFENSDLVKMWAAQQYNSELAALGLSGGKEDPVSTTTQTTRTTVGTTSQGVVQRGSGPWLISLCVGLLTITLKTQS